MERNPSRPTTSYTLEQGTCITPRPIPPDKQFVLIHYLCEVSSRVWAAWQRGWWNKSAGERCWRKFKWFNAMQSVMAVTMLLRFPRCRSGNFEKIRVRSCWTPQPWQPRFLQAFRCVLTAVFLFAPKKTVKRKKLQHFDQEKRRNDEASLINCITATPPAPSSMKPLKWMPKLLCNFPSSSQSVIWKDAVPVHRVCAAAQEARCPFLNI